MTVQEEWLTLREIADTFRVHIATVGRWIVNGIETPMGRVHLIAEKVGGRYRVERAALDKFRAELNPGKRLVLPVQRISARQAQRDREEALAALR